MYRKLKFGAILSVADDFNFFFSYPLLFSEPHALDIFYSVEAAKISLYIIDLVSFLWL